MKVGDVVEVKKTIFQNRMLVEERWQSAIVTAVYEDHESFAVKALKGAFDDEGHDLMMLQFRERNRSWR
jgi:hypothetical protein